MGIFFSILSPALYGISNYIDKFFLERYKLSPAVITIYSGIVALLTGLLVLLFSGLYIADIKSIFIIIASGYLTNIYMLPYFKALASDETSRVVPLFQFIPIFIIVLSYFLLGEKLHVGQYIGAAAIIGGSFYISIDKFDRKIFKIRPSFWYMMLSGFLFSVSVVLYKFGVQEIPFWQTLPYEGLGIALGAVSVFLYKNNKNTFMKETKVLPKKAFVLMSINEIVFISSRYTAYFALSIISVSIVSILAGFQPLFVLLYGVILSIWFPHILKEVISKKVLSQKFIAIVSIFFGLYLIFS